MTLRIGRVHGNGRSAPSGFTLIELILVMALLVIIATIVTPRMASFFRGRTLDNEARRFMTLTRYAQSRAVSEGTPMLVWMDEEIRSYGLEAQPGYLEKDDLAVEYTLATDLEFKIGQPLSTYETADAQLISRNLPTHRRFIRFGPDGFISEQSPEVILIRHGDNNVLAISPSRTWQYYEINTNALYALR